jgi:putative tryptophan/tyrosine transport system substrate-binding protein
MRRRAFILGVGAATAVPQLVCAQTPTTKRVGVLIQGGPDQPALSGLREELKAAGLREGEHVEVATRQGSGDLTSVEAIAKSFEEDGCRVIFVFSTSVALAASRGTKRTPIVFTAGADPVAFGLVESLAKPGGRLTGVHSVVTDATAKRFEFLHQLVPQLRRAVAFYNPTNPIPREALAAAEDTAKRLGVEIVGVEVRSPEDIRDRVSRLRAGDADAYFFVSDAMVHAQGELIIAKTSELGLPAVAYEPDLVAKGALASYGADYRELGRAAARYVVRILAGTHPPDLPVERIDRPSLAINLKTARALGITVPDLLLVRADEVIE